jgi:hypothetical protein
MTNLGGIRTATNSAATLTFTNIIGDTVYIAHIASVSNDFGAINVAVNGTNYGTFAATGAYGNRELENGSDANIPDYIAPYGNGKLWYMPYVVRIPLGTSSRHTVVVTASGASPTTPSGVLWVAGNGQRRPAQNVGPLVLVSGTLRQATWSGSGSELAAGQFSALIQRTVDTLRSDGLPVYYVPTEQWFNEFTEMSGDLVHPSNTGHTTIAAAFQDTVEKIRGPNSAQNRAAKLPSGVSIGNNTAINGDVRLPQGASLVWRNAGAFDGVSITNSGTAIEIDAPNSTGASVRTYLWRGDAFPMKSEDYLTFNAGTPVGSQQTVALAMSSSEAALNKATVTENNSGTAGFSIYDTVLTRTASGSGEANIYRAQVGGRNVFRMTADGRLLIDSADGLATSTRFGVGTDSSAGIIFRYSGSGNSELEINASGSISVSSNDGLSTAKRLSLSTGGGDTTIGTLGSSSLSSVNISQTAFDRRMNIYNGSVIDIVLNSTGSTGQAMTLNPSGGSIFFGASGTANQAMSWSGGTGTDRRISLGGNSIQVSLNSNQTSYQNMSIQSAGGNLNIGSGAAGVGVVIGIAKGTVVSSIRHGRATLVAGTVTVSDSFITTSTRIMISVYTPGGTRGFLDTGTRVASTSFTITSSSILDTSVVDWVAFEP